MLEENLKLALEKAIAGEAKLGITSTELDALKKIYDYQEVISLMIEGLISRGIDKDTFDQIHRELGELEDYIWSRPESNTNFELVEEIIQYIFTSSECKNNIQNLILENSNTSLFEIKEFIDLHPDSGENI